MYQPPWKTGWVEMSLEMIEVGGRGDCKGSNTVWCWSCLVQGCKSCGSVSSTTQISRWWHHIVKEAQRGTWSLGSQTQEVDGATKHSECRQVVREKTGRSGDDRVLWKWSFNVQWRGRQRSGNRGPPRPGEQHPDLPGRVYTCCSCTNINSAPFILKSVPVQMLGYTVSPITRHVK